MPLGDDTYHPLDQSCLFKVRSKKKLADHLYTSVRNLENLRDADSLYSSWQEKKKNGGFRLIEAPFDHLKDKQKRIADLLQRIEPPDYLMAPVKKRSYVTNAAIHVGARAYCLLDIEDFFPSCSAKRVFWFYNKKMQCAPDVSAILTGISTRNGYLPQGSPCSPILAYFAYVDMWEEIDRIAKGSGCNLSIYADDITISGEVVYGQDVWEVKKILRKYGHSFSQKKERHLVDRPVEITGVVVTETALLLPNRQHLKLLETKRKKENARSSKHKEMLERQIRGRLAQAKQVLRHELKPKAPPSPDS